MTLLEGCIIRDRRGCTAAMQAGEQKKNNNKKNLYDMQVYVM